MPATDKRKCLHCHEWFTPDRYNAWHQHYCSEPACQAASHRASNRRWLAKNPDYFRGPQHVVRVQSWRAVHPGYWRRRKRRKRARPAAAPALQDLACSHPAFDVRLTDDLTVADAAIPRLFPCVENATPAEIACALQDVASLQHVLASALLLHIRGEPLQDLIWDRLERVYGVGNARYSAGPRVPEEEQTDGRPGRINPTAPACRTHCRDP